MNLCKILELRVHRVRRSTVVLQALIVCTAAVNAVPQNDTNRTTATAGGNSESTPIFIRAGVILAIGTTSTYDFNIIAPALEVAYARAKTEYNVIFEPTNYLYEVPTVSAVSPGSKFGRTVGCWMWNASGQASYAINDSMQIIIGPACTDDMKAVNELLTFFSIPCITGAANLLDSTPQYPYLTRCGFNTYDMWQLVVLWFQRYNWTNIVIIYDHDSQETNVEFLSLSNSLASTPQVVMHVIQLNATDFDDFDTVPGRLMEASQNGRVIVFLLRGTLLRYFLIEAGRMGMSNGDYVFLTVDLQFTQVLGVESSWRQRDGYDQEALKAYSSLFVLTMRDFRTTDGFRRLQQEVQIVYQSDKNLSKTGRVINYFSAAFHDSVVMLAKSIRSLVTDGLKTLTAANITLALRNTSFQGASGSIFIDSTGDRSTDMTLYYMTDSINGKFSVVAKFHGTGSMYEETKAIPWRTSDGLPVTNNPPCGFLNDGCPDTVTPSVVAGVISGVFILIGFVVWLVNFLRAKKAAQLANNAWIAEWSELQNNTRRSAGSRVSLGNVNASKVTLSMGGSVYSEGDLSVAATHTRRSNRKMAGNMGRLMFATWRGRMVMVRICERYSTTGTTKERLQKEVEVVREIVHENLLRFLGAVMDYSHTAVIGEYCSKGSLQDLLLSNSMKLDWIFRYSLLSDLVSGMCHLHTTPLFYHGRLTSACCYVDGKFILKVGDYGLPTFFYHPVASEKTNEEYSSMYWTAPEHLDIGEGDESGSQAGDVFSFAVILSEIITGEEPYSMYPYEPKDIISRIRRSDHFRPRVEISDCPALLMSLMERCWSAKSQDRPTFARTQYYLNKITEYEQKFR